MTTVIGIDPGITGAIAFVNNTGIDLIADMPVVDKWVNPNLLYNLIHGTSHPILAVVEKVRSMPGQGVASTFKFGACWGMVVQAVAHLPIEQPTPGVWKKAMGLSKDKGASRAMAIDLWPDSSSLFVRVKDDGRAEAALLAEYGRRILVERGRA